MGHTLIHYDNNTMTKVTDPVAISTPQSDVGRLITATSIDNDTVLVVWNTENDSLYAKIIRRE